MRNTNEVLQGIRNEGLEEDMRRDTLDMKLARVKEKRKAKEQARQKEYRKQYQELLNKKRQAIRHQREIDRLRAEYEGDRNE